MTPASEIASCADHLPPPPRRRGARPHRGVPAAGILLVEVFLLLANVIARYVFNRPLVWGDELASILFVWLCVLGAVLAMRRNEHMRLTALISRMSPRARAVCDVVVLTVVSAFLVLII